MHQRRIVEQLALTASERVKPEPAQLVEQLDGELRDVVQVRSRARAAVNHVESGLQQPPRRVARYGAHVLLHLLKLLQRNGAALLLQESVRQPDGAELQAVQQKVVFGRTDDQLGA